MKKKVIYNIINRVTEDFYIGATFRFEERIKDHFRRLRGGYHENIILQRDFDFFGEEFFTVEVVEEVKAHEDIDEVELKHILQNKSENTYNIAVGVMNNLERHPNKESITKLMGENRKGAKNPNWRGGISKAPCKDCGKEIRSDSERCDVCYYKFRDIRGSKNPFYGKNHSDETRKKLSEQKMGKKSYNSRAVIAKGVRYETMGEAARQLGVHVSTLKYWLGNPRPKYSEYYYEEKL